MKAAQDLEPTYPLKIYKSQLGLTLIEVMVVMGLLAAMLGVVIPRLVDRNRSLKDAVRSFSNITRDLRTKARLKNSTYRLVLDLKTNNRETQQYWVESTNQKIMFDREAARRSLEGDTQSGPDAEVNSPFQLDVSVFADRQSMAEGLRIADVEIEGLTELMTEGIVYLHFLPQGAVQQAAIHIEHDKKLQWTLWIHPLTGRAEIFTQRYSLAELFVTETQ